MQGLRFRFEGLGFGFESFVTRNWGLEFRVSGNCPRGNTGQTYFMMITISQSNSPLPPSPEKGKNVFSFFVRVGDVLITQPPSIMIQIKINSFGSRFLLFLDSCKAFSDVALKQSVSPAFWKSR